MKITKVYIEKFRGFHQQEFQVGSQITAIAGQNGTQKSTLLGMIPQVFTLSESSTPLYGEIPLCGGSYRSGLMINSDCLQNTTSQRNMNGHCHLIMKKFLRLLHPKH